MTILFACLNVVFIMQSTSNNIQSELTHNIKPKIVLYSNQTITSQKDFVYFENDDIASIKKNYDILLNIQNNIDYDDFDINLVTNGSIFLIPMNQNSLLIQNSNRQELEDNYNSFLRIQSGSALFGGFYNRLASCYSEKLNYLYLNDNLIAGRTFTSKEMEEGSNVIVLNNNGYYFDGTNVSQAKVGDTINYTLYSKSEDGRHAIREYDLTVIGIIDNDVEDTFQVNFVPEKTFFKIIEDVYPLIQDEIKHTIPLFFLPTMISLNDIEGLLSFNDLINSLNKDTNQYTFISDGEKYASLYGEIKSIEASFNFLSVITVISVCMTLYFVLKLEIKKRQKEIGIYLALGLKQKSIIIDFTLEYLIISFISFVISICLSFIIIRNCLSHFFSSIRIQDILNYFYIQDFIVLLIIFAAILCFSIIFNILKINRYSIKEVINRE